LNKKFLIITALLIVGALSVLYIYSPKGDPVSEWDKATQAALAYIEESPTYGYDGVPGSIKIEIQSKVIQSKPLRHIVWMSYECTHAGYGDRSNKILAQVITQHLAEVTVIEGRVVRVILDGVWDELNQMML
jgi:hypothetical protein